MTSMQSPTNFTYSVLVWQTYSSCGQKQISGYLFVTTYNPVYHCNSSKTALSMQVLKMPYGTSQSLQKLILR